MKRVLSTGFVHCNDTIIIVKNSTAWYVGILQDPNYMEGYTVTNDLL